MKFPFPEVFVKIRWRLSWLLMGRGWTLSWSFREEKNLPTKGLLKDDDEDEMQYVIFFL